MAPRAQAAFDAGVMPARAVTPMAAADLAAREGSAGLRKRAAVEPLHGLAENLDELRLGESTDLMRRVLAAIALDPAADGLIACPTCRSYLRRRRDSDDGHLHGERETDGCPRWIRSRAAAHDLGDCAGRVLGPATSGA